MEILLKIIHFLSLAVGIGIGVSNMVIGVRLRRVQGETAQFVRATQGVLGQVALGAIILLWLTGIAMWVGWYQMRADSAFLIKIVAVIILTAVSVDLNIRGARARRGQATPPSPAFVRRAGMISGLMSVIAVIFAVIAFG